MKKTKAIMGMPITIEIVDRKVDDDIFRTVFGYFSYIDETFSTYKETSEISGINRREIHPDDWSEDMQIVFTLAQAAKERTSGYFDIKRPDGSYDPSGLVKGWATQNAASILRESGFENWYIDAGGDIQTAGVNAEGKPWTIGIKNPFKQDEIIKTLALNGHAVATSGSYIRGLHIYDPKTGQPANAIVSLTVVGPNICDADLIATAAFAMGKDGIHFVEATPFFEAYAVDNDGIATMTSGFPNYTLA